MQPAAGRQQRSSLCLRRGLKQTDPESEAQPQRLGATEYRNRCLLAGHAFLGSSDTKNGGFEGKLVVLFVFEKKFDSSPCE